MMKLAYRHPKPLHHDARVCVCAAARMCACLCADLCVRVLVCGYVCVGWNYAAEAGRDCKFILFRVAGAVENNVE